MKNTDEKPDECYTATMRVMKYCYKDYREKWNNEHDDRKLFCNIYDTEMEALEIMKDIHNPIIWVGYNQECGKDMKVMDEIIDRFAGRKEAV